MELKSQNLDLSGPFLFGEAIEQLRKGNLVTRQGWIDGKLDRIIYKQVDGVIPFDKIKNNKGLPVKVQEEMVARGKGLEYTQELNMIDEHGHIYNWVPIAEDLFSKDWIIHNPIEKVIEELEEKEAEAVTD